MDPTFAFEYNKRDNDIYNSLDIEDLFKFLEEIGYNNRKINTNYLCYEHYKQIFHYSLVKYYNVKTIFFSKKYNDLYNQYNSIVINENTNVEKLSDFLVNLFNSVKDTCCIFIDIKSRKNNYSYHTTLLIYRPLLKSIEHFDSQIGRAHV